ncbi:hypothetical protein Scep_023781 [Stephania cephalantha]|uniref:THUMP domain-containing protein n=1 Tax=Stephania cephalantha TaxID=152367 RepID=A0AAP0HXN2_9MAGN
MGAENRGDVENGAKNKKRKYRFLPHSKPVKKGSYPLRPGVEGFFLTCDGGRERQAAHEAIQVIDRILGHSFGSVLDHELQSGPGVGTSRESTPVPKKPTHKISKGFFSNSYHFDTFSHDKAYIGNYVDTTKFYEELVDGEDSAKKSAEAPSKPLNKKTVFTYSDSSSDDDDDDKSELEDENDANHANEANGTSTKKQRLEEVPEKSENITNEDTKDKSIDKLIEDEIKELGDRTKRHFVSLDSGCNGVVFVQMHKREGDPGPAKIVQHIMTSAASTKKHMSRFILRILPAEITCYASEEEISKAIKPLIEEHFPADAQSPVKFAVLYEARANTGIDRMTIINSVAKSVPSPHKVNLESPDKTIVVQIVKTVCLIGVVKKYKELSKYNLRQLTSTKP